MFLYKFYQGGLVYVYDEDTDTKCGVFKSVEDADDFMDNFINSEITA
jgi:hypothetical protein|tara:strand:- start:77 stop:217 length:141 start_codon:yes stop_codon:yes gene_type:complete